MLNTFCRTLCRTQPRTTSIPLTKLNQALYRRPLALATPLRFTSTSSMSGPPSLTNVQIEQPDPAIAVIRYSRPKSGNALNTPTLQDILAALQWATADAATRIIITTGAGRFYTAGLDLLDPINHGPNSTISDPFISALSAIHEILIATPKITIAAVNGPAPGWGTSSLALHDLVYASPDAIFFTPFAQWGVCAEGTSSYMFTRVMGRQKAAGLILSGARMTAAELESAGLVTKVLGKEAFWEDVLGVAGRMVKLPEKSLAMNKELMMRHGGDARDLRTVLREVNRVECEELRALAGAQESKTAIEAFVREQEQRKKEKEKSKL